MNAAQLIQSDRPRVIVGLGATGASCVRHFSRLGSSFEVWDSEAEPGGLAEVRELLDDAQLHLGASRVQLGQPDAQLLVSPGVALDSPLLSELPEDVQVSGDIDEFARCAQAPIVAVTGSNAKSTVVTLLGEMTAAHFDQVGVGGNLGVPALDVLSVDAQCYVLELSSFQLERTHALAADVACLLNVSADHIDRHGNMLAYQQAKQRVFRNARHKVFNRHDPLTSPLVDAGSTVTSFGLDAPDLNQFGLRSESGEVSICCGFEPLMPVSEIALPGRHNVLNVVAAFAIGTAIGLPATLMRSVAARFSGLPHRCEALGERNGVSYYNDSKATNVGATIAAVQGLTDDFGQTLFLVAGGQPKGQDFAPLINVLATITCELLLIGECAGQLAELAGERVRHRRCDSLAAAVEHAATHSRAGDRVLLSPACASFDMFDNFQQRGDHFRALVDALDHGARNG